MTGTARGLDQVASLQVHGQHTVCTQIKKNERTVGGDRPNDRCLDLVEADVGNGIGVIWPLYCLSGRALVQIPDSDTPCARRSGKDVAGPVNGKRRVRPAFLPRRNRCGVCRGVVGVPQLDAVRRARQELLIVCESQALDDVGAACWSAVYSSRTKRYALTAQLSATSDHRAL